MGLLFESQLGDILALSGIILGLLYYYLTSTYNFWKNKNIPYVKPKLIFGNIKDLVLFRQSEHELLQGIYNDMEGHKLGGIFQFRTPALLVRDPDIIKQIMVKDFVHFYDRGLFPVDEKNDPLSAHLFNLEGSKWRALRNKLSPTFTSGKMKMMFNLLAECCEQFRQNLGVPAGKGEEIEVREAFAQFTTDVIGTCAFGLQFNSMNDPKSDFRKMGRKVFAPTILNFLRRVAVVFIPPIKKMFNLTFEGGDVTKFFTSAIKDTVEYREKNKVIRNDFMHLLIQLKNKGKLEDDHDHKDTHNGMANGIKADDTIDLTDDLLAAQVFVFFLAGFETSSTASSFALYEMAMNPDIQTRLREEVDSVLEETNGEITYDALQKMVYMDKVLDETLRKYPPVATLFRKCTKPYTIPGTKVRMEIGDRAIIPVFALQHDPQYFPNPDVFDPERFTDENKAKRPQYTYMPFGEGPRICIGLRFGVMQAKTGLAMLVRNFEFSTCKKTSVPIEYDPKSIVTASVDGIWLKINKRKY